MWNGRDFDLSCMSQIDVEVAQPIRAEDLMEILFRTK